MNLLCSFDAARFPPFVDADGLETWMLIVFVLLLFSVYLPSAMASIASAERTRCDWSRFSFSESTVMRKHMNAI